MTRNEYYEVVSWWLNEYTGGLFTLPIPWHGLLDSPYNAGDSSDYGAQHVLKNWIED